MDTVDTRSASVPEDGEKIIEIQLERLRTFKNHPFKVRMDQEMIRLSASVEKYGIINPLIVRPIPGTKGIYRCYGVYTGSPIHFPGTENEEIKPGEKADWNKNERDHG